MKQISTTLERSVKYAMILLMGDKTAAKTACMVLLLKTAVLAACSTHQLRRYGWKALANTALFF